MSQKEKKWRRFYLIAMILIYGIFVPVELFEFFTEGGGFPLTVIVVGVGLPIMRMNHLRKIREEE